MAAPEPQVRSQEGPHQGEVDHGGGLRRRCFVGLGLGLICATASLLAWVLTPTGYSTLYPTSSYVSAWISLAFASAAVVATVTGVQPTLRRSGAGCAEAEVRTPSVLVAVLPVAATLLAIAVQFNLWR